MREESRLIEGQVVVGIGEDRLFLYEGHGASFDGQRTAYEIYRKRFTKLPLMPVVKGLSGIIFYASTNTIYLFGGLTRDKESVILRDAIKLDFRVKKWSPVQQMLSGRFDFLPILHMSRILLCGGNDEGTVELYDPKADQYQRLSISVPMRTVFTVKNGEEFWSYSERVVTRWREEQIIERRNVQAAGIWSPNTNQPIVLISGKVYVLSASERGYYEISQDRVSAVRVPVRSR